MIRFQVWRERMSHSHHEPPATERQPGPGTPSLGMTQEMSSHADMLTLFLIMPGTGSVFTFTQSVKDYNLIA